MNDARHLSISIARDPAAIYDYVCNPANLPHWAAGLSGALGDVDVEFTPRNDLGVLDHVVTLPDGQRVFNPLRVLPNGDGSEVVFTLFALEGVDVESDAAAVSRDLATLKRLLEK